MSIREPLRLHTYRGHVLTAGPAQEPVSVPEIKDALRLDDIRDDNYIATLIEQARAEVEDITGLALLTQSWRLSLDHWPTGQEPWWDGWREGSRLELTGPRSGTWVSLPRYPLQSVDSVTVYDEAGADTAVTVADVFDVDLYQAPGRMAIKYGQVWPIALRDTNAIQIVYTAGYTTVGTVPPPIKRAISRMVAHMFTHRGDSCDAGDAYRESGAETILSRYAVARL